METLFIFIYFILNRQLFLAIFCRNLVQCLVSFSGQTNAHCGWRILMDRLGICIFGPFDVLFLIDFMSLVYFYIPPHQKKKKKKEKMENKANIQIWMCLNQLSDLTELLSWFPIQRLRICLIVYFTLMQAWGVSFRVCVVWVCKTVK